MTNGSGGVDELHVAILMLSNELLGRGVLEGVIVAELQESFDSRTRVLRSLSIVSVRKRHDQTRSLEPFLLSRGDELYRTMSVSGTEERRNSETNLIDHDLTSICEISD